jgi:transcriptional regulator with XRE-family HTH domain
VQALQVLFASNLNLCNNGYMDQKAQAIADWAHAEICALAQSGKYKNDTAMYRELSRLAGLSQSLVRQFHLGTRSSPSITTLDKVVQGIKLAKRLHA